jgi:hypothetical protein
MFTKTQCSVLDRCNLVLFLQKGCNLYHKIESAVLTTQRLRYGYALNMNGQDRGTDHTIQIVYSAVEWTELRNLVICFWLILNNFCYYMCLNLLINITAAWTNTRKWVHNLLFAKYSKSKICCVRNQINNWYYHVFHYHDEHDKYDQWWVMQRWTKLIMFNQIFINRTGFIWNVIAIFLWFLLYLFMKNMFELYQDFCRLRVMTQDISTCVMLEESVQPVKVRSRFQQRKYETESSGLSVKGTFPPTCI